MLYTLLIQSFSVLYICLHIRCTRFLVELNSFILEILFKPCNFKFDKPLWKFIIDFSGLINLTPIFRTPAYFVRFKDEPPFNLPNKRINSLNSYYHSFFHFYILLYVYNQIVSLQIFVMIAGLTQRGCWRNSF